MKAKILGYVKPKAKLIWAERTKFFSTKQDEGENVRDFVSRLRNQAENCKFDTLRQSTNIQKSMVVHQVICGILSKAHQEHILQNAELKTPTVSSIVDLVDNLNQISKYIMYQRFSIFLKKTSSASS